MFNRHDFRSFAIHRIVAKANLHNTENPQNGYGQAITIDRQRHRLIPQAVVLGLLTGLVAVGLHLALDIGDAFRDRLITLAHQNVTSGPWLIMGFSLLAVALSVGLVARFAPEAAGSGIAHVKTVLLGRRIFRWLRILIITFLSTIIANIGGLIVGRGGPSAHMGSAIGQGLATFWPSRGNQDRSIWVAAGGGAGLAAAFNAPLSGLIFILEELERRCPSLEFFAAAIACLTADMVCRSLLGQYPTFHFAVSGAPPLNQLIAFVPLGILSAILGSLFTRCLLWGRKFAGLTSWPQWSWWLALALMITAVAWLLPELLGGGQSLINAVLEGNSLTLRSAMLFFALRFVLTIGSASSGAAGGLFIPILTLGALLGWGVGVTTHLLFPELNVDSKLFAAVGMAAYFSGVVQAPLTGIVLVIEMTSNYALILPLFISCFSALLIADWLRSPDIFEALLANNLRTERIK